MEGPATFKFNENELKELQQRFSVQNFDKLREIFHQALQKGILFLKQQIDENLQQVYVKRHKGLGHTAVDYSADGMRARARIGSVKYSGDYPQGVGKTDYRVRWFEYGTKERYVKRHKEYVSGKEASNHSHHKKVVFSGGIYRGKMPVRPFFNPTVSSNIEKAMQITTDDVMEKLKMNFLGQKG